MKTGTKVALTVLGLGVIGVAVGTIIKALKDVEDIDYYDEDDEDDLEMEDADIAADWGDWEDAKENNVVSTPSSEGATDEEDVLDTDELSNVVKSLCGASRDEVIMEILSSSDNNDKPWLDSASDEVLINMLAEIRCQKK